MPPKTSTNGQTAESSIAAAVTAAIDAIPEAAFLPNEGRVLGAAGAEVVLAGETYHWARFTAAGMRALHTFIQGDDTQLLTVPTGDPDSTIGAFVAEALVMIPGEATARLQGFFQRTLAEGDALPADIADACAPEEIATAVDAFFHQSGLRLLESLLKNSLRQQLKGRLAERLGRIADETAPTTTPEQPSTS